MEDFDPLQLPRTFSSRELPVNLTRLRVPLPPTVFHEDNQGCIACAENDTMHDRMKHVDVKYHRIRDFIKIGQARMLFTPTNAEIGDVFTKNLDKIKFYLFRGNAALCYSDRAANISFTPLRTAGAMDRTACIAGELTSPTLTHASHTHTHYRYSKAQSCLYHYRYTKAQSYFYHYRYAKAQPLHRSHQFCANTRTSTEASAFKAQPLRHTA